MRRALNRYFSGIVAAFLALIPLVCSAHGLLMKVRSDGTTISGTAYYSNGEKAVNQPVAIIDLSDALVLRSQGTTDAEGNFTFSTVEGRQYRVEVYGEEGHEVTMEMTAAREARGKLVDNAVSKEEGFQWPPAWALIGGALLLSVIPALRNRRKGMPDKPSA